MAHVHAPVDPLHKRAPDLKITGSLEQLVLRTLAKEQKDRFPSMAEIEEGLASEIELIQIARGEKVSLPAGRAASLGLSPAGTHLVIGGRQLPLWSLLPVVLLIVAGVGFAVYRQLAPVRAQQLQPGELVSLRARAQQHLLAQAGAGAQDLRLGAVAALGLTREPDLRTRLEAFLAETDPALRAQAAEALGQLGDRRAEPVLRARATSATERATVRIAAARALELLGDESGTKLLQQALEGKDDEAAVRAALALCERGNTAALNRLSEILGRERGPSLLGLNILSCQARAGQVPARQALLARLDGSGPREMQLAVASKLALLSEGRGRALLEKIAAEPGPDQLLAARLLAGPDAPATAILFRQVLKERSATSSAHQAAAEGLGLAGATFDARLLGTELQSTGEPAVQLAAASSIIRLALSDPSGMSSQSLSWARDALADSNYLIRQNGVAVLGDAPGSEAVPLLARALSDSEAQVRRTAARALGRRAEGEALQALRAGLQDSDEGVRLESLRSLARVARALQRQGADDMLKEARLWFSDVLTKGSAIEQALARSTLLSLGDQTQRDKLGALRSAGDVDLRRALAEQPDSDLDVLLALLKDVEAVVRWAAARALAERGDRRALPVLKEVLARGGSDAVAAYGLLRRLGEEAAAPSELETMLSSPSVSQRLQALEAVGRMPAELAAPLLVKAARDPEPLVRRLAAEVIGELPESAIRQPTMNVLRVLVHDPDGAVRARAAAVLARLLTTSIGKLPQQPEGAAPAGKKEGGSAQPRTGSGTAGSTPAAPGEPETPPAPADAGQPAAPAAAPDLAPAAATATPPSSPEAPAKPVGRGFLVVEAKGLVQFQIDGHPWQEPQSEPIPLSEGAHRITSISGVQTVDIVDKQTATVQIPESQVEQLARTGIDAFEHSDMRKAQRLLEKANALCARDRKHPQACSSLTYELSFRLASLYEGQELWSQAMTEYQKLAERTDKPKGKADQRPKVQEAIIRLAPRLGQVIIPRHDKKKCQEVTVWMPPGTHIVEVDGESQTVKVRAREQYKLGSCP